MHKTTYTKYKETCKRLRDDVLHISKKTAKSSLGGFLSICQAEASCIFPAACLAAMLPLC